MAAKKEEKELPEACPNCGREGHDGDATFCKFCGAALLSGEVKESTAKIPDKNRQLV